MVKPLGKFASTSERSISLLKTPQGWIILSAFSFIIGLLLAFLNFNISNIFAMFGFLFLIPIAIFWMPGVPQMKFTFILILGGLALISLLLWNWVIQGLM